MAKLKQRESGQTGNAFQFTLTGLIIFSLALIGGSSFFTYKLAGHSGAPKSYEVDVKDRLSNLSTGPWGSLLTRDIQLERPAEYLTDEVADPQPQKWTFNGMTSGAVKQFLLEHGLTSLQVEEAFAPDSFTETTAGTELIPTGKFLLFITPEQRLKLYSAMAGAGVNLYVDFPYIFPGDVLEGVCADSRLHPDDVALLKRLVYSNGPAQQLADYQFLLSEIPTAERRVALTRALSRQSAVLARLAIQPDTDIDKIAAYWGKMPHVRFTDIRPLMESLKQLPGGGNISLLYLLPKFARERLYTFPLPSQAGDPTMDCHWSTFNFCNDTPDNRLNDPAYAVEYIRKNFYQIAAPSLYGDIVLLMNEKQEVKHSAVYIADDIVFTKNGNNYRQPWMLMRIPDLLSTYPATPPMRVIYMRRKTE
jgi:hypothetical protein